MFKNYLKIAWRNILNNRLYSAINILGLAIGLGACLLLMLFITDEMSFDQFWTDSERLYRLESTYQSPGRDPYVSSNSPGKAKQALLSYFSQEISSATRLNNQYPIITVNGANYEEPIYFTDADTADIFDVEVIKGDLKQTLQDNRSIALSEELAIKYFGRIDVLGEVLTINLLELNQDYRVGAVYKRLPKNTIISFNALVKINEADFTNQAYLFDGWQSPANTLIFKLKSGANIASIENRLAHFVDENVPVPDYYAEQFTKASEYLSFNSQQLQQVYINSPGKKDIILVFSSIALLILVIAGINFTNLSIARSSRRAREVAMRKVLGASRAQLIIQFLGETIFIALIALVVGVAMAELALPVFNNFLGRELAIAYGEGVTLGGMLALVIFIGVIGGIYPALILSRFSPAAILQANKIGKSVGSFTFTNLLVIFQFTISISLIICAVVIYQQREYTMSMELGYDKDHIVILHGVGREPLVPRQESIRQKIKQLPGIISATYIDMFPATGAGGIVNAMVADGDDLATHTINFRFMESDYQATFDAEVIAGRMFSDDNRLDLGPGQEVFDDDSQLGPFQTNIMLNEMAAKRLGFGDNPADAIGKLVQFDFGKHFDCTVVGVIADVNYQTVRTTIKPEVYFYDDDAAGFLAVRFSGSPREADATLKSYWQEHITEVPFVRTFVDELIQQHFQEEQQNSYMAAVASALAIIVACMGLFGLASFTAERRTKEIGLRKVMGASVSDITQLLVWQFSKPVLIASVIASVISFMLMSTWLEDYPYRIDNWQIIPVCLLASVLSLMIAWLTIGGNAVKVARAKPIKALRYE